MDSPNLTIKAGPSLTIRQYNFEPKKQGPTAKDWEKHKAAILTEFGAHGLPLAMLRMRVHHDFFATEDQYKYRLYKVWKVKKGERHDSQNEHRGHQYSAQTRNSSFEASMHFLAESVSSSPRINEAPYAANPAIEEQLARRTELSVSTAPREILQACNKASQRLLGALSLPDSALPPSKTLVQMTSDMALPNAVVSAHADLDESGKRNASINIQSSKPGHKKTRLSTFESNPSREAIASRGITTMRTQESQVDITASHSTSSSEVSTPSSQTRMIGWASTVADQEVRSDADDTTICKQTISLLELAASANSADEEPSFRDSHMELRFDGSSVLVHARELDPDEASCSMRYESCDVIDLPWGAIRRLRDAADILTTCFIFPLAFKLHFTIWKALKRLEYCPWGPISEVRLRQAIACARTAEGTDDLATAERILESHTLELSFDGVPRGYTNIVRMLLVDIHSKKAEAHGPFRHSTVRGVEVEAARRHRTKACEQLPPARHFSAIQQVGVFAPDLNVFAELLRAYGLNFLAKMPPPDPSSADDVNFGTSDWITSRIDGVKVELSSVWMNLTSHQYQELRALIRWCRFQLSTRSAFQATTADNPTTSGHQAIANVLDLFNYLVVRMHDATQPHSRVAASDAVDPYPCQFLTIFDDMVGTSSADLLYAMSCMIVNNIFSVHQEMDDKTFQASCFEAADKLYELPPRALMSSVFEAVATGPTIRPYSEITFVDHQLVAQHKNFMFSQIKDVIQDNLNVIFSEVNATPNAISGSDLHLQQSNAAITIALGHGEEAMPRRSEIPSSWLLNLRDSASTRSSLRSFIGTAIRAQQHQDAKSRSSEVSLPPTHGITSKLSGLTETEASCDLAESLSVMSISPRTSGRVCYFSDRLSVRPLSVRSARYSSAQPGLNNLVDQIYIESCKDMELVLLAALDGTESPVYFRQPHTAI